MNGLTTEGTGAGVGANAGTDLLGGNFFAFANRSRGASVTVTF